METKDLYMKMLTAKDEAAKFGRLAEDLDKLIAYATLAKEKADEMEDNLKTYARMLDDKSNLDPDDENDVEWGKELEENLARAEKELVDPLKGSRIRRRSSLRTLLSLCKDYGDYSGFTSPMIDRAEAEEDAERRAE